MSTETEKDILRERLDFLLAERAKGPPPEVKFWFKKEIEEVAARLRELGVDPGVTAEPVGRWSRPHLRRWGAAVLYLLALGGVLWICPEWRRPGDCRLPVELIDRGSGRLSSCVDDSLRLARITYQIDRRGGDRQAPACNVPVPEPLDLAVVPAFFDREEHCPKLSTVRFSENSAFSHWPRVPAKVQVEIQGVEPEEAVRVHVLTDDHYTVDATVAGETASATLQIGVEGFLSYLELPHPLKPRLPDRPVKNMPAFDAGPVALLVVTATDREGRWRRSKPYPLVRSGVRSADDVWLLDDRVLLAFVAPDLPPLVVFQSPVGCEPPQLQGIFAATLDGQEVFRLSPPDRHQFTLVDVAPGPPGQVFFRGAVGATVHCYHAELDGEPIQPRRVSADACAPGT